MTVLSSEGQLVETRTALLPRVNLLPSEIREGRRLRQIQVGLGASLLGAAAVVGLLFVSASHGVSSAQSEVDAASAEQGQLNRQVAQLNGVTATAAAAAAAKAQVSQAMSDEVRYSQVLNDLALTVPSNVWLTNVTIAQAPATAQVGAAATAPALLGTITYQGVAFNHDDVATWLEALASVEGFSTPYFSNASEALIGTRPVVNFASTNKLNANALSHRYDLGGS